MPRLPRRRRAVLKWTGAGLCALIFAVWFGSRWWSLSLQLGMRSDVAILVARSGQIIAECGPKKPSWTAPSSGLHVKAGAADPSNREWRCGLDWYLPIPVGRANSGLWLVYVPLYIPFVLLASPTVWLFYRDRRRVRWAGAGRCVGCGYDLSGLPPGGGGAVCPECGGGKAAHPAQQQSSK